MVIFSVEGEKAVLEPFIKKSLLDFYGTLPVKRKYPGFEATRREVHQKISNQESPVQTPFQKVRHLLGVAESGVKDLGENHRAYLMKKIRKSAWI